MSARYTTRVAEDLINAWDVSRMPEGLRIVSIEEDDLSYLPWRIVTFDDDGAPEELNGQRVTPLFRIAPDGRVVIVGRDMVI